MTRTSIDLTFDERRATCLKLKGRSLAYIARDLKLDGCLVSKTQAEREAKALLKSVGNKIGKNEP